MKLRKTLTIALVLLMLLSLLTGCGAATQDSVSMEYAAEAPAAMESNGSLMDSGSGSGASLPENRKWIITVDMSAETEDLDTLIEAMAAEVSPQQAADIRRRLPEIHRRAQNVREISQAIRS